MPWPTIQDPSEVTETFYKAQHRSQFESGRVISRAKHLRARHRWTLTWNALPESDWETLKAAFNTDLGKTFMWFHGRKAMSYTVRYAKDSLQGIYLRTGYYKVSVELEED